MNILRYFLISFILFLTGCALFETPLSFEIQISPSNRIVKIHPSDYNAELPTLFMKVKNNLNEIIILDKITYSINKKGFNTILLNNKTLEVGEEYLKSVSLYIVRDLDIGTHTLETNLHYKKGDLNKNVTLTLGIEIYDR